VMALIARAFLRLDPFEVWGTGAQIRSWTYVDDIVAGTLLAAERIDDGSAVNLGSAERISLMDAARLTQELTGHHAPIAPCPDMPTGPLNRVADDTRARRVLGWSAGPRFADGLQRTIAWYFANKDPVRVARRLEAGALLDRRP
jgi:UDP-glucose 4-epimerase